MTEQISAIWMFQAILCVFKKYFLREKMIFTFKQKLLFYKGLVVQTSFTYWNNIVEIFLNRLKTIIILTQR